MGVSASAAMAMAMIGSDYRFVGQLGAGGGGTVLLAHHQPTSRYVAVKTVVNQSNSALARLRREGRALAALDHPSILKVYRLVEENALVVLVTEYLDGGDLEDALSADRLRGASVVGALLRTGEALVAAHAAGVVHRDVKPSNVLLGRDGRAVLADFGLSRFGGEFRTQSGAITGTPMYMAPEQITAPDVEAPTADVYSYAAVVYRALTGRPPFAATDLKALADMHLSATPGSPRDIRPGLPKVVCEAVLGALAKRPRDRPAIGEVIAALNRVDADTWDAILPDPRPPAAEPAGGIVDAAPATGSGTEADADVEPVADPGAGPVAPRRLVAGERLLDVEQPVFTPSRTPRWRNRALVLAGGVLAGLVIGLLVLAGVRGCQRDAAEPGKNIVPMSSSADTTQLR